MPGKSLVRIGNEPFCHDGKRPASLRKKKLMATKASKIVGIHNGNKSNVPNTCAPRHRTKPTKAESRLAARIKDFDNIKGAGTTCHRPGSLNK